MINKVVILFDIVNIIIIVYLFYKIIFQTPAVCIGFADTLASIISLTTLLLARIIKEIIE